MKYPLLAVKFFIPPLRPGLTSRQQLTNRFIAGLVRPLTLLSAPAGFGKSTLLSAGINRLAANGRPDPHFNRCAWLSLDAADNHPPRFWTYFIAAFQARQREPDSSTSLSEQQFKPLLDLLQADTPPPIPLVLDEFINTITNLGENLLLVLDDYHLIQSDSIHEQITYLLEHQPPNLRLVISTRADPPLPIARLRARGQLSEFRSADLRFRASESASFLQEMVGFDLLAEDIAAIEASTEGWIAGLQMAGLALQTMITEWEEQDVAREVAALGQKAHEFIASFSGKHIYILDYLADEVFNRLSEEVQNFLLKTSILERMNADLCAAVVQPDGPSASSVSGILEYLERSNLFLIRLDNQRQWFRYHHLFADLLRARLEQTHPDSIPELHLRASRWFEQNGAIEEAVTHAIAAQAWDWAARLMETHVNTYLERGQLATVLKWIDSLPANILRSRPNLCTNVAFALAHAGETPRIPPLIEAVEHALARWEQERQEATLNPTVSLTVQDAARIRATLTLLRAYGLILAGLPEPALRLAQATLDTLTDLAPRELAWLHWVIGYAQRGLGNLEQAQQEFRQAVEFSRSTGTVWEDMATDLAITYRLLGRLESAAQVFRESLRQAEAQGIPNKGNVSRVEAYLSAVLLEQNRVEEALAHARQGVAYLQWWPSHNHITTAYAFLGLALLGTGQVEEAAEVIQKAEKEHQKGQVTPFVVRLVENARIRLWLTCGNWDALDQWLTDQQVDGWDTGQEEAPFDEYQEMHLMALARVWIGKGRKEDQADWFMKAARLLTRLQRSAEGSQRVHANIEICLLHAVTLYEIEKRSPAKMQAALACLTRSLAMGIPGGYIRTYIYEGMPAADLLHTWLRTCAGRPEGKGVNPLQVKNLLDQFPSDLTIEETSGPKGFTDQIEPAVPVEPLTEREQQILQLLALGLSNREMAERLVVSEGTVKTHVHNLIGKLGAQSRTHVLARAKAFHLL